MVPQMMLFGPTKVMRNVRQTPQLTMMIQVSCCLVKTVKNLVTRNANA